MNMIFSVFLSFLFIIVLWYVLQIWKFRHIRYIPGPVSFPLLGCIHLLMQGKGFLRILNNLIKQYGSIVKICLGPTNVYLLITDRALTEFILKSARFTTKDGVYEYLRPWLGNSLLFSTGDYWRQQRNIVANAFHLQILKDFHVTFKEECDILNKIILEKIQYEEIINIEPIISAFTLDNVVETALGAKLNVQRNPQSAHLEAMNFMKELAFNRACSLWKRYDCLFRFSNDYQQQKDALKVLNDFSLRIINERRKLLETNKECNNYETKKRFILIDSLFHATIDNKPLTDTEINEFVNGTVFAGYDTTATTLNLLLYELGQNPEIQKKLVDEIRKIFADDINRDVTTDDFNKMKYMDLVIKETLRYHTPIPVFLRKLTEDVDYNGIILPSGLSLLFYPRGIHRSSQYYKNPDKFDPERFLMEEDLHPFTFLAFSAGYRNCIGQKYAMTLMKTVLTTLLKKYEFISAGPKYTLKLKIGVVMSPKNGVHIKVKRRNL